MDLASLDKVCFTVCLVSIVTGVLLGLAPIWGNVDSQVLWKGVATCGVLFLGASATLAVNRTLRGKGA